LESSIVAVESELEVNVSNPLLNDCRVAPEREGEREG